jgi:glycerol-3-phosphate dehydrogenase
MERDFQRLRQGPFDLLVIGGGVYGAWTAYDAALRGLRVALIEKNDWASGTSSASSKLIHGGLRYLQYRRFGQVRRALRERSRLRRAGPHRVRPLRFVLPLYAGAPAGRFKLEAGLWLYDRFAGRNRSIGRHRSYRPGELIERYGFLNPQALRGGFTYWDSQTDDARFVVEVVDGALEGGAVAVNRAEARELLLDGKRVVGAQVVDLESDETIEVRATATVNCAGPWSEGLVERHRAGGRRLTRLSKGVHLVMPPLPTRDAVLLLTPEPGRVVFLIPWYCKTLLGTTDTDHEGPPEEVRVEDADVSELLGHANGVLHGVRWTTSDVVSSFVGLRTLPVTGQASTAAVTREWKIEEPLEQLFMPVGGKYTSARADAAHLLDRILGRLGGRHPASATHLRPLPWRPEGFRSWSAQALDRGLMVGLDESTAQNCLYRYGSRAERLFDLVEKVPGLADRIVPDAPFCLAEIAYAARYEMARNLEDVLVRRVPLMRLSPPAQDRLRLAALILGKTLGWSDRRIHEEIASLGPRSAVESAGDGSG